MVEPGTVAEHTNAIWALVRQPLVWVGERIGVTTAPEIYIGDLQSGALKNDPRPAYREGYLVMAVRSVQREDWRSRLLTTQAALGCTGTIRVITALGHEIIKDDALFCAAGAPPSTVATIPIADTRFHVPVLATISKWVPHHVNNCVRLQPGTYLLGHRFFAGLHDHERLPAGSHSVVLTVRARNSAEEWQQKAEVEVPQPDPLEPPLLFRAKSKSKDRFEMVNLYVRASERVGRLHDVRVMVEFRGKERPLHWSVDDGDFKGQASITVHSDTDAKILLAVRALGAPMKFLDTQVGANESYLTDVGFRVHKKAKHLLNEGKHECVVIARFGNEEHREHIIIDVPSSEVSGLRVHGRFND
jgi:hypothetical protein